MERHLLWGVLALPLLLGALFVGHAQVQSSPTIQAAIGPVWPRPPIWLPPIQQVLHVESVSVSATITDGGAQTDVEQVYRNDTERAQEGIYLFPVPEGATLTDFALYDGDRKMTARLMDKDEASQTYENIVNHLRDPALLQYVGRNTYEVRLYPVPPYATRKITLRYAEALRPEAGGTRKYVYSFVADAMGGTQQTSSAPAKTTVQITVQDAAPLTNVYSGPLAGILGSTVGVGIYALPSGAVATTQSLNLHASQRAAYAKSSVGFDNADAANSASGRFSCKTASGPTAPMTRRRSSL